MLSSRKIHKELTFQPRMISKRDISGRKGRTGAVLSTWEPLQNGRVGTNTEQKVYPVYQQSVPTKKTVRMVEKMPL